MRVDQYVIVKPKTWSIAIFGQITSITPGVEESYSVECESGWGINSITTQFEEDRMLENVPPDAIIEIDWYNDYYMRLFNQDRDAEMEVTYYREHDVNTGRRNQARSLREPNKKVNLQHVQASKQELMKKAYDMIALEAIWKLEDTEKVVAQKPPPKPKTPFVKNDIVTVSNVNGYPGETFQAIVAAMGKGTIVEGEMIRDLVWNGVAGAYGINKRVDLGVTQALVFYTKDFPDKQIWDKVQWRYSGKTNFAKKVTLRL